MRRLFAVVLAAVALAGCGHVPASASGADVDAAFAGRPVVPIHDTP